MILSQTRIHCKRTGASVRFFCRQCVMTVRGRGAGRALIMIGAVSLQVGCNRKPLQCFEKGKNIRTDWEGRLGDDVTVTAA